MAIIGISIASQGSRSTGFGTQGLDLPRATDTYQASSNNPQLSTALLDGPPSFRTNPTICSTPIRQCGPLPYVDQPVSVPSYGQGPVATASNDHLHWCVVCDDPREIKTCDGFKRHMREHETRFYCMLQGPEVHTENGPKCAFCDVLHPDRRHLGMHNIQLCENKTLAERSYPRKNLLTNHLKYHKVVEPSILADQWRNTIDKKFFACGFCGSCFDSHGEQTTHIDVMHYRRSEHISNWDYNKVIRGLLSQPGVRDCWRELLATNPYLQESSLTWELALAKKLQLRLERSEETAEVLLRAAIAQSNYGRSDPGFADPQMDGSQSTQTLPHRRLWSPLHSVLDHDAMTHIQALPSRTSGQQLQQLVPHQTIESSINTRPLPPGSPTKTRSPPDSGETIMQLPHSFYAPSSVQPWASSGSGGLSPVIFPSFTRSSNPRQGAEAFTVPVQAPMRSFDPTLATQYTPRTLSPNRITLPLGQVNSSFATADQQMHFGRPQSQQSEGYDCDDLDDSSHSNMQRIVQDKVDKRRRR